MTFDDAVSYTKHGKWIAEQLSVMAVTGFIPLPPRSPTSCLNQPSYLPNPWMDQCQNNVTEWDEWSWCRQKAGSPSGAALKSRHHCALSQGSACHDMTLDVART